MANIRTWSGNTRSEHMKELLAKQDALGSTASPPGLLTLSDPKDAETLERYAKANLPGRLRARSRKRSMKSAFGRNSSSVSCRN